jgi:ubiquinone/menaquinone biosynthesis C-methylase UbiE
MDKKEKIARYYSHPHSFFQDRKVRQIFRHLKIMPTDHILEVGNGPRNLLEKIDNYHTFVTDVSSSMIQEVKKRDGNKKHFFFSDAGDLPLKKGSFETVFCSQLLENATLNDRVIKEIYRILTDYGQLALIVSNDKFSCRVKKLLSPLIYMWNFFHSDKTQIIEKTKHEKSIINYNKKKIKELLYPYFLPSKVYPIPYSFLPFTYVILCNKNPSFSLEG